jgi:hypothetical protein
MQQPSRTVEPSRSVEPTPSVSASVEPDQVVWPYEGYPRIVARFTLPPGARYHLDGTKVVAVAPNVWQQYEGGGSARQQAIAGQALLVGRCPALQDYMRFQRDSLHTNPFPGTIEIGRNCR